MNGWIKVAALVVAGAIGVSVYFAWRGQQKATAELQSQLKAAQQSLAEATARQDTRDAQMAQLLSQLDKQKAAVQRPDQVVKALPNVLPLPKPIEIVTAPTDASAAGGAKEGVGKPSAPVQQVSLPIEDLKPLYDFASDCKACQVKLAAAQGDLKDEQAKTATVSRERDAALRVARGGSGWHRVAVAAKWFALGAAAGAVAVKLKR
jgi:hypothetical protein